MTTLIPIVSLIISLILFIRVFLLDKEYGEFAIGNITMPNRTISTENIYRIKFNLIILNM
jgi:hypothetical protein